MKIIKIVTPTLIVIIFALFVFPSFRSEGSLSENNGCEVIDIWSSDGSGADNVINISDISVIISNWKWEKLPSDLEADVWGENGEKDNQVDIYDVSKALSCYGK